MKFIKKAFNKKSALERADPQIYAATREELTRLQNQLQLIPSENYASEATLDACGSVLNNKYSVKHKKCQKFLKNFLQQTFSFADNFLEFAEII